MSEPLSTGVGAKEELSERELRERVRYLVGVVAPLKDGPVKPTSLLNEDLGYDSLGLVELIIVLEEELGLPEANESLGISIKSVKDLEDLALAMVLHPPELPAA